MPYMCLFLKACAHSPLGWVKDLRILAKEAKVSGILKKIQEKNFMDSASGQMLKRVLDQQIFRDSSIVEGRVFTITLEYGLPLLWDTNDIIDRITGRANLTNHLLKLRFVYIPTICHDPEILLTWNTNRSP